MSAGRDLSDRLYNWARCHRWYGAFGRCFSLEGQFRPKRGQEVEWETGEWKGDGPPKPPPPDMDILDAWEIELAWRSLGDTERWVLKLHIHDRTDLGTDRLTPWQGKCKCSRIVRQKTGAHIRPNEWWNAIREARHALRCTIEEMEQGAAQRVVIVQRGEKKLLQTIRMWGITPANVGSFDPEPDTASDRPSAVAAASMAA